MDKQRLGRKEVIALLQQHGITPTQQRVHIGRLLFARDQHVSAEQVLTLVNEGEIEQVSKATVYNTLNLFTGKGILREIIVDPTKVFYDSNTTPHHHFFNVDTGELLDMDSGALQLEGMPSAPEGTVPLGVDVIIRVRNAPSQNLAS